MKIEGICKCQNCNGNIEWYHILGQNAENNSMYDVDSETTDKENLNSVIESKKEGKYNKPVKATVYCPKCRYLNTINI